MKMKNMKAGSPSNGPFLTQCPPRPKNRIRENRHFCNGNFSSIFFCFVAYKRREQCKTVKHEKKKKKKKEKKKKTLFLENIVFVWREKIVWMTRSSDLWLDGNTGHDFHGVRVNSQDHGRSHVYMFRQNMQAESRQQEDSRDKLQQLCYAASVLTTMKSPHFFSAVHMITSSATCDFVKINFSLPRQVSPIWLALFVARVFLRMCESKAATASYALSVAFMATAHTAHCVITELVPRHWNLDASCAGNIMTATTRLPQSAQ